MFSSFFSQFWNAEHTLDNNSNNANNANNANNMDSTTSSSFTSLATPQTPTTTPSFQKEESWIVVNTDGTNSDPIYGEDLLLMLHGGTTRGGAHEHDNLLLELSPFPSSEHPSGTTTPIRSLTPIALTTMPPHSPLRRSTSMSISQFAPSQSASPTPAPSISSTNNSSTTPNNNSSYHHGYPPLLRSHLQLYVENNGSGSPYTSRRQRSKGPKAPLRSNSGQPRYR